MTTLARCAKRFEDAIAAEQYDQAATLLAELRQCLDATPPESPERTAMMEAARNLLTASLRMVRAQRAHHHKEFTTVNAGRQYALQRKRPAPAWQLEA